MERISGRARLRQMWVYDDDALFIKKIKSIDSRNGKLESDAKALNRLLKSLEGSEIFSKKNNNRRGIFDDEKVFD